MTTWQIPPWERLAIAAAAGVVFFCLTLPKDLRESRWLRVILGTAMVWAMCSFGTLVVLLGIAVLALLWSSVLSHYFSQSVSGFLGGGGLSQTGILPDYHFARNHRRDGEMKEAINAIRHELTKDPNNFEGLVMLAEIHLDLNQPDEAMAALQTIARNPDATPAQLEIVSQQKAHCERVRRSVAAEEIFRKQSGG